MSINIFLLLCLLLPEKETVVNTLLKKTGLINKYAKFWNRISEIQPQTDGEDGEIKITYKIDDAGIEETIGALFHIYMSILMNIRSIACAVFAAEIPDDSIEISEKCNSVAEFFAWYTGQFTAQSFYELTVHDIVPIIDQLRKDLQSMNKIFQESRHNLKNNFLHKLNDASNYQPLNTHEYHPIVIEDKFLDSENEPLFPGYILARETELRKKHDDIFRHLWHFMGPDALKAFQYFYSFTGGTATVKSVNHLIVPLEMSFQQWQEFLQFEAPKDLSSVESVLELEIRSFQIATTILKIPAPHNLFRNWVLEPNASRVTDYQVTLISSAEETSALPPSSLS